MIFKSVLILFLIVSIIPQIYAQNDYPPIENFVERTIDTIYHLDLNDGSLSTIETTIHYGTEYVFSEENPVKFNVTSIELNNNAVNEVFFVFHYAGEGPGSRIRGDVQLLNLIDNGEAFRLTQISTEPNTFFIDDVYTPLIKGGILLSPIFKTKNGETFPFQTTNVLFEVESKFAKDQAKASIETFKQSDELNNLFNSTLITAGIFTVIGASGSFLITRYYFKKGTEPTAKRQKAVFKTLVSNLEELKVFLDNIRNTVEQYNSLPEPKQGAGNAPEWTDWIKVNHDTIIRNYQITKQMLVENLQNLISHSLNIIDFDDEEQIRKICRDLMELHNLNYENKKMWIPSMNHIDEIIDSLIAKYQAKIKN